MLRSNSVPIRLCSLPFLLFVLTPVTFGQVTITTERYDQSRLGANLSETQLNTTNVNVNTFGKLWSYTVSGSVYAQPLYIQGVNIPGKGTRNVLYVVTMNDVVYGFDADSSSNAPLLILDLTTQVPGSVPVPITDIVGPNLNIVGNIGIESTPHIDLATNTMYLVARTKESGNSCGTVNGSYCQRLHALDISTFAEKFGGPVIIQGSVPGTGNASVNGTLNFDPKIHNQRSSLALANGQIFIGWASHEDQNPYHGWVMSYSAASLQQTGIWCSSPDGFMGGIWMSGRGPVVDGNGNVYYISGNGDWNGTRNFGESFVKFGSSAGMPLLDWFTPDNWSSLNAGDTDLGSSGPILIPGTDLLLGGGKASIFYLMHTSSLGHEQSGNGQIVQSLANNGGEIKGGPVYWNRSGGVGPWMYAWSNGCDYLKAYHFNGTRFDSSIVSESTIASPCGASGGVLTLSANGSTPGSGIVWSSMPLADDGDHGVHQGILRALNADDLSKELWNSRLNATRDDSGNWPKYSPPTVVGGRVYLASFPADGISNASLNVYGLLTATPDFAIAASPASSGVNPGGSVSYTISTSSLFNFSGAVALSVSGLPAGATASFASNNIGTPGSTKLSVSTTAGTPLGSSTLTITGTSGSLTHTTSVTLTVTTATPGAGVISIDFVGRDTPMSPAEVAGVVARSNWNEAQGSSGGGFALVDETGTTTGATISWSSSPVWSLPIADTPGNLRMMNGYLDTVGQNTTVSVAGLPANASGYDIYVYADGDNGSATRTGAYQISGTGITTAVINLTDAANINIGGAFTQANNSAGNYVVFSITATGFTLTAIPSTASDNSPRAPVNGIQIVPHAPPPDFSLSLSPSSETLTAGSSTTYSVTASAKNGFNGTVSFSASGLPSGAGASFNPTSVTGSGSSTMTVTTSASTPAGTYTITITGASPGLTHTTTVSLTVNAAAQPNFSLSRSPSSVTIVQGGSAGTSTITITPSNGFASSVTLSATGVPSGVTAAFSPNPATPTSTLTLTASSTATTGTATVTVTGTSDSLTHTTTVSLTVNAAAQPNFSLSASPNSVTIVQGGSAGTSTITITPSSGFAGSVNLSATVPNGVTAAFSPNPATSTSTLTLTASSTAATGTTTVTVTGTSGSLTHTTTVTLTVNAAATPNFSFSASPNSVTIVQGGSAGTSTITITPSNGFASSVSLSATGVPSGVTAVFSPNPATSTSTLTLTASRTASAATQQNFSLSASPSIVTITQGSSGTSTITINPTNGFNGSVGLSASGLPSGVTPSFNPSSTTSTSTLTLTASSTATTGTFSVRVRGRSGTLSHSVRISLTVL